MQRSVWITPYAIEDLFIELREKYALNEEEFRLIISKDIGGDRKLKKSFGLH